MRSAAWWTNRPLLQSVAAALVPYLTAVGIHRATAGGQPVLALSFSALLWLLAGAAYTHWFEYFFHSVLMHRGMRYLETLKRRHLEHHQIFTEENFRSRDPRDLRHVTSEWYVFPTLFALHYFVFLALLPARAAPWFFLGVTAHFLAYEVLHWCIHLEGNLFDAVVSRLPLLGPLRARQIHHHLLHHTMPVVNFNFTPPYGGDRLGRTYSRRML